MKKSQLKQLIKEIIKESLSDEPPKPKDPAVEYRKAVKAGDVEGIAYYRMNMQKDYTGGAWASWEQYRGSAAYDRWIKNPETIAMINQIKDEMKRWNWKGGRPVNEDDENDRIDSDREWIKVPPLPKHDKVDTEQISLLPNLLAWAQKRLSREGNPNNIDTLEKVIDMLKKELTHKGVA